MQSKVLKGNRKNSKKNKDDFTAKFPLLADFYDTEQKEMAFAFNEEYKNFLNLAKTEREAVQITVEAAEELGFAALREQTQLSPGMKVYHSIKGKGLVLAVIGKRPLSEGFRILGAHVDSPRLDLKPMPLVEDKDLVYFKTHYYGGIKKYQWASVPLALHGIVTREDGSRVEITVGEAGDDPQFLITDLLIHLSAEQMGKKASEIIPGEALNIIIGASAIDENSKSRFKLETLRLLNSQYGITERDLATAEICAVPAYKSVDIGFDRMMVGSYGHDDRVCAYPAIQAVFSVDKPEHTVMTLLTDKEEVGSEGNTGAASRLYENVLLEIYSKLNKKVSDMDFRLCLESSAMLSTDVTNALDPNFTSVSDEKNEHLLGHGLGIIKYSGSRGKSGASDANAEFLSAVTRLFDREKIQWQIGEMGKVDAGGGGTIAKHFANLGMEVLDCGVPVLSMHAPFELVHKYDVYETYRAYKCFIEKF